MATSMDSTNTVTIEISGTQIECSNIIFNRDRQGITVSMSIKNIGPADLLVSVNNFCLSSEKKQTEDSELYAQHCYINDGQSFEVISGWRSILRQRTYTLIMKYVVNPNLTTYNLGYKTANEQYQITHIKI